MRAARSAAEGQPEWERRDAPCEVEKQKKRGDIIMNEVWLSGIGILLALCGMTVLIFRRVSPIIVGPLAALLVTLLSGLPVLDSVTGVYVQGVGSFFVSYFMIFLLGNLLGSLYQISGAAAKIGETVVRWFGAKNCMVACLISAALLSYGGINSFVIIFAIYPLSLIHI